MPVQKDAPQQATAAAADRPPPPRRLEDIHRRSVTCPCRRGGLDVAAGAVGRLLPVRSLVGVVAVAIVHPVVIVWMQMHRRRSRRIELREDAFGRPEHPAVRRWLRLTGRVAGDAVRQRRSVRDDVRCCVVGRERAADGDDDGAARTVDDHRVGRALHVAHPGGELERDAGRAGGDAGDFLLLVPKRARRRLARAERRRCGLFRHRRIPAAIGGGHGRLLAAAAAAAARSLLRLAGDVLAGGAVAERREERRLVESAARRVVDAVLRVRVGHAAAAAQPAAAAAQAELGRGVGDGAHDARRRGEAAARFPEDVERPAVYAERVPSKVLELGEGGGVDGRGVGGRPRQPLVARVRPSDEEERRRKVGHCDVDLLGARVGEQPCHHRQARVVGACEAAEPLHDLRRPRCRDAARAGADRRAVGERVHQQRAEDDAEGEEVREELQVGRVVADAADALVAVRLVHAERRRADLDAEEADARRQQRRQRARAPLALPHRAL